MLFIEPLQGLLVQRIKHPVVYYEMKHANFTEVPLPSPWDDGNCGETLRQPYIVGKILDYNCETFPLIPHVASFEQLVKSHDIPQTNFIICRMGDK